MQWFNSLQWKLTNQKGVMTSVTFQIDPRPVRVLHGQPADGNQRRREQERNAIQGHRDAHFQLSIANGQEGRLVEAMALDRHSNRSTAANLVPNAAQPGAAVRFLAAGGQRLDLDQLDYEDLYRLFPSHAPRGAGSDIIETCSNVFK